MSKSGKISISASHSSSFLTLFFKSFLKYCVDLPLLVSKHIFKCFHCSSSVKLGSAILIHSTGLHATRSLTSAVQVLVKTKPNKLKQWKSYNQIFQFSTCSMKVFVLFFSASAGRKGGFFSLLLGGS